MAVASVCPDVSVLQQLALGAMPPQEVEHLARHCEQCPRCIQLLHSFKAEDTLIEAMAAQGTAPDQSRDAVVNALIQRLKSLPSPALSSSMEMTTPLAGAATPSGQAAVAESIENTLASDVSLAPAQSPDEIGRLGGYRVLKMLGAGGMGMVYHAEDVHLQRPIALKVMKPDVAKNPTGARTLSPRGAGGGEAQERSRRHYLPGRRGASRSSSWRWSTSKACRWTIG